MDGDDDDDDDNDTNREIRIIRVGSGRVKAAPMSSSSAVVTAAKTLKVKTIAFKQGTGDSGSNGSTGSSSGSSGTVALYRHGYPSTPLPIRFSSKLSVILPFKFSSTSGALIVFHCCTGEETAQTVKFA
ncbi:Uncharacterized protein BM_BM11879 [Brugia malayi]|uniref:Uncharacterized protein n=2 Tax=Brugia malayi TaxID=6279 RepID=A0A4E9FSC3_BRUMA|nr:Uncharacterized protein BM_BM11879 [Brugia malayi]VIO99702.1 Uncharacterized protein BM_BM11879 [Brugia malayi]